MISCRDAAELIPLHVGDALPGEEAVRIEEHLETCALCSAEYASFAGAREALVNLREEMPALGSLWADVSRSIGANESTPMTHAALVGAGRPRRQPRWAAWTGLAAAAALAVAFLPSYFQPTVDPSGSDEASDQVAAQAPLIQPTTQEELNNFLLRSGVRILPVPPVTGEELLPLTTPAAAQPAGARPVGKKEAAKVY